MELAEALERMNDLTLANERVMAAQKEADNNFQEMSLRRQRVLVEMKEYAKAIKNKSVAVQQLLEEKTVAIPLSRSPRSIRRFTPAIS